MSEAHGVPAVWFTTGTNADLHQLTDEPAYIDDQHLAAVDRFVQKVVTAFADMDRRPALDRPRAARWACQR